MVIVGLVILIFLWHVPSAIIPIVTIPIAVLISFVPMHAMGMSSNIMSLGGIAIAVGAMVDAAIVVVEQTHKKLEDWDPIGRRALPPAIIDAVKEVGGPSFFALLVIAVSFLPVLTLEAQEGRLFKPLAYTKTSRWWSRQCWQSRSTPQYGSCSSHMNNFRFPAAWLARVTNAVLVGKIHSEEKHPISRILMRLYDPVCVEPAMEVVRDRWRAGDGPATVPVYQRLGIANSCRRSMKARCSTCPPRCPESP